MTNDKMGKIFMERLNAAHYNREHTKKAYEQAQAEYNKAMNELLSWRNPK